MNSQNPGSSSFLPLCQLQFVLNSSLECSKIDNKRISLDVLIPLYQNHNVGKYSHMYSISPLNDLVYTKNYLLLFAYGTRYEMNILYVFTDMNAKLGM